MSAKPEGTNASGVLACTFCSSMLVYTALEHGLRAAHQGVVGSCAALVYDPPPLFVFHRRNAHLFADEQEVVLQAKMLGLANGGPGEPDSAAGFLSQVRLPTCTIPTCLPTAVQFLLAGGQHPAGHARPPRVNRRGETDPQTSEVSVFLFLRRPVATSEFVRRD